ncbi:MAG: phosphoglucomutase/phosphomannomutase family protein, partial [Hungatella sp.]
MIKFGTGGWRAIIGDEFTRANIQRLSKALADKMKDEGVEEQGIAIGYDRRFLSKESAIWASEVFAAEDIPVWFISGSAPTPLIMFYVMRHDLPYGMMITASHNPAVYNGIKVFTRGGRDADEIQTQEMEHYLDPDAVVEIMDYEDGKKIGIIKEIQPLNEYLDNIIGAMNMQAIRDRGLRVAIDPMYGVSNTSLRTILSTARCDVQVIHEEHDTLFGGKLPAPSAFTLR